MRPITITPGQRLGGALAVQVGDTEAQEMCWVQPQPIIMASPHHLSPLPQATVMRSAVSCHLGNLRPAPVSGWPDPTMPCPPSTPSSVAGLC